MRPAVRRHVARRRAAGDGRICRPSLVHRGAISPGIEEPAVRDAPAVRQLHFGGGRPEPVGLGLRRKRARDKLTAMTKLEQIEKSVAELSEKELKAFAKWFEELQADLWDRQIEADAKAGRLDNLIAEAKAEI